MCSANVINRIGRPVINFNHLRLRNNTQFVNPASKLNVRKRKTHSSEIDNYILSNDHLVELKNKIPARFLKKNRKAPDDLYLIDCKVAREISTAIKSHILDASGTIIETNPGFGFLTKDLLQAGLNKIHLYDTSITFREHILKLDAEYPGRIKLFNKDFFSIWKLSYQDRHDNGDRVKRMLSGVEVKSWASGPTMTIIGTLSSSNLLRHLMLSLIFQFGVMTYGRCELFVCVPASLYLQLTAGPETGYLMYRPSSVLFQLMCEHQVIRKLPRKAFLPWDNTMGGVSTSSSHTDSNSRLHHVYTVDPDSMYLTRIVFRRQLPVPVDKLQHLWYFVLHMMLSRKRRIIPSLEKWVPGSGARLIIANSRDNLTRNPNVYPDMDIFTQIGQLTAPQILNLYKDFATWPEYSESPFIASMETALVKMESVYDHSQDQDDEHTQADPWASVRKDNQGQTERLRNHSEMR